MTELFDMVSLNMAESLVQVVLERWTVTELTVLFTIFVGLVGILVGLHFYQKQWIAKYGPHANWLRVEKWLENQNLQIPTMDETIEVMNKRLKNLTSEVSNAHSVCSLMDIMIANVTSNVSFHNPLLTHPLVLPHPPHTGLERPSVIWLPVWHPATRV